MPSSSLTRLLTATAAAAVALGPVAQAVAAPVLSVDAGSVLADRVTAIVTLEGPPTEQDVAALRDLGLTVQPLKALPMALVAGPADAVRATLTDGIAVRVDADERLAYHDTASSDVMSSSPAAAAALRAKGFTGKGVTVGVVDSGCDATHPDLAERVKVNEILLSPEYANQAPDSGNTIVVPMGSTPYSNTDLGSGHGTHVAGIIASDSTSAPDGSRLGVAPEADLACFAIGAVISTSAVVTAFDHILSTPGHFDIDVVNNSWGNSFRQFDPQDPVNVATKALSKEGITVVFSAGNSGHEDAEASVSPFNQAPWVISVAAGTLERQRGSFSSNGLRYDNSEPVEIGEGGHTVATGDRIGLVHPDLTAPGVDISSSCDSTGTVIGPCPEGGGNASASGTSMSAPHVAGAAAVLLQAQPRLTPTQVRRALEATATVVRDADGARLPFWQVGFGHVNLDRAVDLVRGKGWRKQLRRAANRAERRVLASDDRSVLRSDLWQYDAPPVALGGSDSQTFQVKVRRGTRRLHVVLVHPTPGTVANIAQYAATVTGPDGEVLGTTSASVAQSHGTATLDIRSAGPGTYTVDVVGDASVSDPDTIDSDSINGRVVFLQVAQVR